MLFFQNCSDASFRADFGTSKSLENESDEDSNSDGASALCNDNTLSFTHVEGRGGTSITSDYRIGQKFLSTADATVESLTIFLLNSSNTEGLELSLFFAEDPGSGAVIEAPVVTNVLIPKNLNIFAGEGPGGSHPIKINIPGGLQLKSGSSYRVELLKTDLNGGGIGWAFTDDKSLPGFVNTFNGDDETMSSFGYAVAVDFLKCD
ncbi:MAG: hypothetical protein IT287_09055 [Bdellovibrionaceae bacterium]|nr:hypothetical protein [Pseudobdellovibrionaceae bacterium]